MLDIDDDYIFSTILSRNRLQELQELKISKTKSLSSMSAYTLIENCPNIRRLGMLEFWGKILPEDLQRLRKFIRERNLDVDTGEGHNIRANTLSTYWSKQSQSLQSS